MPGLLDYLYPKGWGGGLLGYGNAAADQVGIDQERAGLLSQGLPGQAIMHRPMDNPMGFAMGTSNVGKPIRAFHGSPHDFDKFDLSKIGTGEGAQAYGHGLYFAENEGVAKAYRNNLAQAYISTDGGLVPHGTMHGQLADAAKVAAKLHPDQARQVANYVLDGIEVYGSPQSYLKQFEFPSGNFGDAYKAAAQKAIELNLAPNKGRMYEVNLHADPNKFLDWDKPLSGQGETVKQGIEPYFSKYYSGTKATHEALQDFPVPTRESVAESMKGDEVLQRIFGGRNHKIGDRETAANALREAGIPGIKYLDQGSRGAGDGTRNFVVFDPKIIEIVRKYGLGALGLTGLLGAQEGEQTQ